MPPGAKTTASEATYNRIPANLSREFHSNLTFATRGVSYELKTLVVGVFLLRIVLVHSVDSDR